MDPTQVTRGDPWFEDGNVVLLTDVQSTAFRLHRGVLARHSEVFQDMFGMPQPPPLDGELLEGCQVVRMYDLPQELASLVKALYDGPSFSNRDINDFFHLAGILRLATKYFINQLRRQSIAFLGQTWPSTLTGHDSMVSAALAAPKLERFTYPYVHPLHVLNLARELDIDIVVPSALYFLSLYPLSDLLKGDHPKLLTEHPSRPSSILTSSDLQLYTLMFQHRLQIIQNFIRQFCGKRAGEPVCHHDATCGASFSRIISQLHRSWSIRTGPLHYILQTIQQVLPLTAICNPCRDEFQREATALREQIWDELPAAINMPGWTSMS